MKTAPTRPAQHPDKWIMTYSGFDPGRDQRFFWSDPKPCANQAAAKHAALTAQKDHERGGVKVFYAVAYPPEGIAVEPFIVDFQ